MRYEKDYEECMKGYDEDFRKALSEGRVSLLYQIHLGETLVKVGDELFAVVPGRTSLKALRENLLSSPAL